MMRWIAVIIVLLAGLASANPSDEFVKQKASIDTRHLEDALKNLKSEETNETLSDIEFLLLTSFFMTASGQPSPRNQSSTCVPIVEMSPWTSQRICTGPPSTRERCAQAGRPWCASPATNSVMP